MSNVTKKNILQMLSNAKAASYAGDFYTAQMIYMQIIENGNKNEQKVAKFELGVMYDRKNDYNHALEFWLELADQGDADAQYNLAMYYHYGLGVEENDELALKYFKKAASKGHQKSIYCVKLFGNKQ